MKTYHKRRRWKYCPSQPRVIFLHFSQLRVFLWKLSFNMNQNCSIEAPVHNSINLHCRSCWRTGKKKVKKINWHIPGTSRIWLILFTDRQGNERYTNIDRNSTYRENVKDDIDAINKSISNLRKYDTMFVWPCVLNMKWRVRRARCN